MAPKIIARILWPLLFLTTGYYTTIVGREGDMFLRVCDKISDTEALYSVKYYMKCRDGEFHLKCLDDTSFAEIEKPAENAYDMKRLVVNDKKLEIRFNKLNLNYTIGSGYKYVSDVKYLKPYLHVQNREGRLMFANAYSVLPEECLPSCKLFPSCCPSKMIKSMIEMVKIPPIANTTTTLWPTKKETTPYYNTKWTKKTSPSGNQKQSQPNEAGNWVIVTVCVIIFIMLAAATTYCFWETDLKIFKISFWK